MGSVNPLKQGHLIQLMGAGFPNNEVLTDPESQQRLLVRGSSHKGERVRESASVNPNGEPVKTTVVRQVAMTTITTLTEDGTLSRLNPVETLDFVRRFGHAMSQAVARRYAPLYTFELGRYGERIGWRGSLFPTQKHVAAAAATRLEKEPSALIVGEMGSGKSRTGAAVSTMIEAKRTLVLCPPHLVKKWIRECQIVRPEAEAVHLKTIADVDAFFRRDADHRPQIGVMKFTSASLGSGWRPAYQFFHLFSETELALLKRARRASNKGEPLPEMPERLASEFKGNRSTRMRLLNRWVNRALRLGVRQPDSGRPLIDPRSERLLMPERIGRERRWAHPPSTDREKPGRKRYGPFYTFTRGVDQEGAFSRLVEAERMLKRHGNSHAVPKKRGRWPLAKYIKAKYAGRIDLTIVDEIHMLKGGTTDRGQALDHLAAASKKVLGLTGTLFGGYASSLFYILWRIDPAFRRGVGRPERRGQKRIGVGRWIDTYGFREFTTKETKEKKHGKSTGNVRSETKSKEATGTMPGMLEWVLARLCLHGAGRHGEGAPPLRGDPDHRAPVR